MGSSYCSSSSLANLMETLQITSHSEDNSIIECLQLSEIHGFLITTARLVTNLTTCGIVLLDFDTAHVHQGTKYPTLWHPAFSSSGPHTSDVVGGWQCCRYLSRRLLFLMLRSVPSKENCTLNCLSCGSAKILHPYILCISFPQAEQQLRTQLQGESLNQKFLLWRLQHTTRKVFEKPTYASLWRAKYFVW